MLYKNAVKVVLVFLALCVWQPGVASAATLEGLVEQDVMLLGRAKACGETSFLDQGFLETFMLQYSAAKAKQFGITMISVQQVFNDRVGMILMGEKLGGDCTAANRDFSALMREVGVSDQTLNAARENRRKVAEADARKAAEADARKVEEARKATEAGARAKERAAKASSDAGFIAYSDSDLNWNDAQAFCKQKGGKLPRINNSDSWDGENPPPQGIPIDGFGAVGAPWPEGMGSRSYWTGTASPPINGHSVAWAVSRSAFKVRNERQPPLLDIRVVCVP